MLLEIEKLERNRGASSLSFSAAEIGQHHRHSVAMTFSTGR